MNIFSTKRINKKNWMKAKALAACHLWCNSNLANICIKHVILLMTNLLFGYIPKLTKRLPM